MCSAETGLTCSGVTMCTTASQSSKTDSACPVLCSPLDVDTVYLYLANTSKFIREAIRYHPMQDVYGYVAAADRWAGGLSDLKCFMHSLPP